LILKRGRAKPLWHGHPWVYAQAVGRIEGEVTPGTIVDIHDDRDAFVGRGVANPDSAIAARVLTRDADEAIDADWLRRRLGAAVSLRQRLGLPNEQTDCYRLINAEGDAMAGLIVDVYGDAVAVQRTCAGYEELIDPLVSELQRLLSPRSIAEVAPGSFAEVEGLVAGPRMLHGESATSAVRELGLSYEADLFAGQKTGLYLDQRENHALARQLAAGARVLDVYSYVGGFALNAAKGGAKSVTAIDASARAVEAINTHAEANGVGDVIEAVEADAFRALADIEPASVDLLILDPPKFARSRRELEAALKGYKKLHRRAVRALAPGGVLISAVCSQLVRLEELTRLLAHAAVEQHREARLLEVRGAGPDHPRPPAFGEGDYLKVLVCQVD
jgi:23S rRNA (cytosine1962-C5)-methyltransferase